MNIQPDNQQTITDDQELAKVLAGISQQADTAAGAAGDDATTTPEVADEQPLVMPDMPVIPEVAAPAYSIQAPAEANTSLDAIKKEALGELRPLVDKLNVPADEKFDTYLLLLRSTDDQSLIAPAHEAARSITDEARRAQALLDIIKEIDYLSNAQQAQQ